MGLDLCRVRVAIMLAMAGPLGSCSFQYVQALPERSYKHMERVECTESVAAPVVDTVLAVAAVLYLVDGGDDPLSGHAGGALVPLAIFGGSAAYGYALTSDCRAELEWLGRGGYGPGPP